jgi:hypothetical protein
MAITIDELWSKLEKLEVELREARDVLKGLAQPKPVTWEEWEASRRERVRRETEEMRPVVDAMFKRWGIQKDIKPIPAEQLHLQMLSSGIKPEDKMLSRAIIEMREE